MKRSNSALGEQERADNGCPKNDGNSHETLENVNTKVAYFHPQSMKQIPLTKGYQALVDDEDFEFLSQWKWCSDVDFHTVYARRTETINGKRIWITMAARVLHLPPGTEVDHRDRNGLNNQKRNLRIASDSQNSANHGLHCTNTSGFKGVSKNGATVWKAMIKVFGKDIYLGTFKDKKEAAKAYDKAAVLHFGEFALTNEMMGLL